MIVVISPSSSLYDIVKEHAERENDCSTCKYIRVLVSVPTERRRFSDLGSESVKRAIDGRRKRDSFELLIKEAFYNEWAIWKF